MARQQQQSAQKQRSQGGGRTSNSEPRVQVFKGFNGMDFEHGPHNVMSTDWHDNASQEDLIMTKTAFQKNVAITNNMTLESVPELIKMLSIMIDGDDMFYTTVVDKLIADGYNVFYPICIPQGPSCLVGEWLFLACEICLFGITPFPERESFERSYNVIVKSKLGTDNWETLGMVANDFVEGGKITHIYWAQERLIACDVYGQVWRSIDPISVTFPSDEPGEFITTLYGAITVPKPVPISLDRDVNTYGSLMLSVTYHETNFPYRISVAGCIDTMFGPTPVSEPLIFYSNIEVAEWNEVNYMDVTFKLDPKYVNEFGAIAYSLYYTVDDAYELQFAQRAEFGAPSTVHGQTVCSATVHWHGYLTDTNMWTIANLDAPTQNFTKGPTAMYCIMIDGRMYFWGGNGRADDDDDTFPPYRIQIGGNPGNLFSTSPSTGGGFVDIEPGTGKYVNSVVKYKTQSGANIVTALCGSRQSQEEFRYNLVSSTVSISQDNSTNSWTAEHVSGSVGCREKLGALVCEDGLYTINRYGIALTTQAMEYNNQIRTQYVSDPIKPVFLADKLADNYTERLLHCDGVIYYSKTLKSDFPDDGPVTHQYTPVFCYDVNVKAWWCVVVPSKILGMIHIDSKKHAEGVGFVTSGGVYVLPTTNVKPDYGLQYKLPTLVETANLSVAQPNHGYQHLTQVEFDFDRFEGDLKIELIGTDIFGRKITVTKEIHEEEQVDGLEVYMRIDLKLREYKIRMSGYADYRLNCFMTKLYVMSAKVGIVWGFDDKKSYRSDGDIQQTFKCYNDVVEAVVV